MITDFTTFIKEGLNMIDDRSGFFTLLQILDELKFSFIKTSNYLNVGNYFYFFRTERIKKPMDITSGFESKEKVMNTAKVYNKINTQSLCFYFGIRNGMLEYGLYNDFEDMVYKTGEFKTRDGELRKMKSYKCLALISGVLRISSTKTLNILHQIKKDLKYLFEDKKSKGTYILTTMRIRKIIQKDLLKDIEDLEKYLVDWCNKYPWSKKVESYIDDSEDDVSFYIKIKPNESDKPITL